jgi:hypothetical protein
MGLKRNPVVHCARLKLAVSLLSKPVRFRQHLPPAALLEDFTPSSTSNAALNVAS